MVWLVAHCRSVLSWAVLSGKCDILRLRAQGGRERGGGGGEVGKSHGPVGLFSFSMYHMRRRGGYMRKCPRMRKCPLHPTRVWTPLVSTPTTGGVLADAVLCVFPCF
jgi:hypothetical protein